MRLEATVPDIRGAAMEQLAAELGLSNSRLVDEALALFLKAVVEIRRGRRLVTMDDKGSPVVELSTPALAALEWAAQPQPLKLSKKAAAKIRALVDGAQQPNPRLRAAFRRH